MPRVTMEEPNWFIPRSMNKGYNEDSKGQKQKMELKRGWWTALVEAGCGLADEVNLVNLVPVK